MDKKYFGNKITKRNKHLRWNVEKSPDNYEFDSPMARYHFIVLEDSDFDRKNILDKLIYQITNLHPGIVEVREVEGNIKNSKCKYLFKTVDSIVSTNVIDFNKLKIPIIKDVRLKEKKFLKLEDYVSGFYQ